MGLNDRLKALLDEARSEAHSISSQWAFWRQRIYDLSDEAVNNSLRDNMDRASVEFQDGGVLLFLTNNGIDYELRFKLDREKSSMVACTSNIKNIADEKFSLDSLNEPMVNNKIVEFAVQAMREVPVTDTWRVVT
jgi:hypothetical protein